MAGSMPVAPAVAALPPAIVGQLADRAASVGVTVLLRTLVDTQIAMQQAAAGGIPAEVSIFAIASFLKWIPEYGFEPLCEAIASTLRPQYDMIATVIRSSGISSALSLSSSLNTLRQRLRRADSLYAAVSIISEHLCASEDDLRGAALSFFRFLHFHGLGAVLATAVRTDWLVPAEPIESSSASRLASSAIAATTTGTDASSAKHSKSLWSSAEESALLSAAMTSIDSALSHREFCNKYAVQSGRSQRAVAERLQHAIACSPSVANRVPDKIKGWISRKPCHRVMIASGDATAAQSHSQQADEAAADDDRDGCGAASRSLWTPEEDLVIISAVLAGAAAARPRRTVAAELSLTIGRSSCAIILRINRLVSAGRLPNLRPSLSLSSRREPVDSNVRPAAGVVGVSAASGRESAASPAADDAAAADRGDASAHESDESDAPRECGEGGRGGASAHCARPVPPAAAAVAAARVTVVPWTGEEDRAIVRALRAAEGRADGRRFSRVAVFEQLAPSLPGRTASAIGFRALGLRKLARCRSSRPAIATTGSRQRPSASPPSAAPGWSAAQDSALQVARREGRMAGLCAADISDDPALLAIVGHSRAAVLVRLRQLAAAGDSSSSDSNDEDNENEQEEGGNLAGGVADEVGGITHSGSDWSAEETAALAATVSAGEGIGLTRLAALQMFVNSAAAVGRTVAEAQAVMTALLPNGAAGGAGSSSAMPATQVLVATAAPGPFVGTNNDAGAAPHNAS